MLVFLQNNIETLARLRLQLQDIIAAEESAFRATVDDFNRRISVLYAELQAVVFQEKQAHQAAAASARAAQNQPVEPQAQLRPQAVTFIPVQTPTHPPQQPLPPAPSIPNATPKIPDVAAVLAEESSVETASSPTNHLHMLFPVPQQIFAQPTPVSEPAAPAEELSLTPPPIPSNPENLTSKIEDTLPEKKEDPSGKKPSLGNNSESLIDPSQPIAAPVAASNGKATNIDSNSKNKAGKAAQRAGSRNNHTNNKQRGRSTQTGFEDILEGRYGKTKSQKGSRNTSPHQSIGGESTNNGNSTPPEIHKEEEFPSLGSGGMLPTGPPATAWGANSQIASKLQQAPWPAHAAATRPEKSVLTNVEEAEIVGGLRVSSDAGSDMESRRRVRRRTFELKDFDVQKRREVNVAEGLELHLNVLSPEEEAGVVAEIESWIEAGKAGELRGRTFSAPKKWMPGKGRVTIQFGCCYNCKFS